MVAVAQSRLSSCQPLQRSVHPPAEVVCGRHNDVQPCSRATQAGTQLQEASKAVMLGWFGHLPKLQWGGLVLVSCTKCVRTHCVSGTEQGCWCS